MDAIIKSLLIILIPSVTSQVIENQSVSNEGVIVGPETPFYYLTYPQPDYLKVDRVDNVFVASPAYNYYRDPSNREGTYFFRILIVADYFLYKSWKQQDIIDDILEKFNKTDNNFGKLKYAKIKLVIAGVVIPQKSDIWSSTMVRSLPKPCDPHPFEYYEPLTVRNNIIKWLTNEKNSFEGISFDMFIFMSNQLFWVNNPQKPCEVVMTVAVSGSNICTGNTPHGGLVYKHPFLKNGPSIDIIFSFRATQIIGVEMLTYNPDEPSGCEKNHFMDFNINENSSPTWSECSERAFRDMHRYDDYDCLRDITYEKKENNDL